MPEIDVNVTVGGVLPLTVPLTISNTPLMPGSGYLAGWSLREAVADTLANVSGSAVAPAAGATIVTTPALAAGTYVVTWTVGLQGAAAAADANNFQLFNGAAAVEVSVNPGVAGEFPQAQAVFTVTSGATVSIKAVGAGTAAVTYSADLNLTPDGVVETIIELVSGADTVGVIGLSDATADTAWFGPAGPCLNNGLTLNVVAGACKGSVYVVPSRP
jgi:hypothetical protein